MSEIWRISSMIHKVLYKNDLHESLCSRAYRLQGKSLFWSFWVVIFGRQHCKESFDWWNKHEDHF